MLRMIRIYPGIVGWGGHNSKTPPISAVGLRCARDATPKSLAESGEVMHNDLSQLWSVPRLSCECSIGDILSYPPPNSSASEQSRDHQAYVPARRARARPSDRRADLHPIHGGGPPQEAGARRPSCRAQGQHAPHDYAPQGQAEAGARRCSLKPSNQGLFASNKARSPDRIRAGDGGQPLIVRSTGIALLVPSITA